MANSATTLSRLPPGALDDEARLRSVVKDTRLGTQLLANRVILSQVVPVFFGRIAAAIVARVRRRRSGTRTAPDSWSTWRGSCSSRCRPVSAIFPGPVSAGACAAVTPPGGLQLRAYAVMPGFPLEEER